MSINESLNQQEIKDLKKELKKYKKEHDLYRRILAVLMVKSGETRKKPPNILMSIETQLVHG